MQVSAAAGNAAFEEGKMRRQAAERWVNRYESVVIHQTVVGCIESVRRRLEILEPFES